MLILFFVRYGRIFLFYAVIGVVVNKCLVSCVVRNKFFSIGG